jgi:hypothetical protein
MLEIGASQTERAQDPFASPTKVIAFHVDAAKKGAVLAPKQVAKPVARKPVAEKKTAAKASKRENPQPRPRRRLPRATPSFYVHYARARVARALEDWVRRLPALTNIKSD